MNIFDYFSIAIYNIKGKKRQFYKDIILISLSIFIFIISSIATDSIGNIFNKNIKNNISYRSIYVMNNGEEDEETLISKLNNISHIQKVVTQKEYNVFVYINNINKENIDNGGISLCGADDIITPEVIAGRKMNKDETGVCIVPKKIYPYIDDIKYQDIMNGEDLLNKEIEIEYYKYDYSSNPPTVTDIVTKKLKVVGVYDPEVNMGEYNDCYINFKDIKEIYNTILENSNYNTSYDSLIAIVDSFENVNMVLDTLNELGYESSLHSVANEKLIETINTVSSLIASCILVIAISNIVISVIRASKKKKEEIGLLKAFGYKKFNIWCIMIIESFLISLISFIIACLLVIIIICILKIVKETSNSDLKRIDIILKYNSFIYGFVVATIIPLITRILSNIRIVNTASIIKGLKNID